MHILIHVLFYFHIKLLFLSILYVLVLYCWVHNYSNLQLFFAFVLQLYYSTSESINIILLVYLFNTYTFFGLWKYTLKYCAELLV